MLDIQVKGDAVAVAASGSSTELFLDVCVCIRSVFEGMESSDKLAFRSALTGILGTPMFWELPIERETKITGPAADAACKKIFGKEGSHGKP